MTRHNAVRSLAWAALAGLLGGSAAFSGGVSTSVGEVKLMNLQIGKTYSMQGLANFPLTVVNREAVAADIQMKVLKHYGSALKPGYEPLPDVGWVILEKENWPDIPAGGYIARDVKIRIPNDPKLRGRAFQFGIACSISPHYPQKGPGAGHGVRFGMEVQPRFLITIARKETDPLGRMERGYPFNVEPSDLFVGPVEPGKVYDLDSMGKRLLLENPKENGRGLTIALEVLSAPGAEVSKRQGYPDVPDPRYLLLDQNTVRLEAGEEKPVMLTAFFPKRKEFARKNYMFVIKGRTLDAPVPFEVLTRVFVSTGEVK